MSHTDTTEQQPATDEGSRGSVRRLVLLLQGAAYNQYVASFSGSSPALSALFNELQNPQPGDLVMEVTTYGMKSRDPLDSIGHLVKVEWEPIYATRDEATKAGWDENDAIPTEKIWTIALDFRDGREFRWANATFIKVKTDRFSI